MNIKQIVNFQLKYLRMAGFLEFVQQVLNIVKTYRDSGEAGVSQLPAKVEARIRVAALRRAQGPEEMVAVETMALAGTSTSSASNLFSNHNRSPSKAPETTAS